jgi:hypothetical protein
MRYCTWKLTWEKNYGYGPEQAVADNGGRLASSMWVNADVEHGEILGYLTGEVDLSLLSKWQLVEKTQHEALLFAQELDSQAYLLPDGIITTVFEDEETGAWIEA